MDLHKTETTIFYFTIYLVPILTFMHCVSKMGWQNARSPKIDESGLQWEKERTTIG